MRVLIATVTAGGGHLAAAAALDEAWRAVRPEDTVEQLDLVQFFSSLHRKIHADGYVKLVEHAPELWGMMFAKTDNPRLAERLNRWRRVFTGQSRTRFGRFLKEYDPDVVVCTHYLPLETLGGLKAQRNRAAAKGKGDSGEAVARRGSSQGDLGKGAAVDVLGRPWTRPFVASVVTDFEAHALWMEPCVDLYCVAAEETKARLVARGAAADNVFASGIPIAAKFLKKVDAKAVRKANGWRDDLPVLLVLSGGFGMGPVADILAALDKVDSPFQTLVVTGRNEELRRELAAADRKHPTQVLGFASNMHELMAVTDLVITKPGGLTSSEALAMGKPLFIINPIPGQEAANSDFLLEHGAAAKANRIEDLPFRISQLLGSKKLAEMAKAAKALGRPDAARRICGEVLRRAAAP